MNAEHKFRCFAKINLCLVVGPRRADGFHDIDTVFQSIDLHDTLTFTPSNSFAFSCSDATLPSGSDNLVVRAARLFAEHTGINLKHRIHLKKRIPVAAGLGGGSSDAAATLRALNMLEGDPISTEELKQLALQLGSDVPFFLLGGRARGRSRGEALELLKDLPVMHLVIVKPNFSVSAAEAYEYFDLTFDAQFRDTNLSGLCVGEFKQKDIPWRNDLERGVFAKYPVIQQIRETLLKKGALDAMMCGSGSAVVARFSDEETARIATQTFKTGEQNVILTKSLTMKQFREGFVPSG